MPPGAVREYPKAEPSNSVYYDGEYKRRARCRRRTIELDSSMGGST
jgi:hypothetical protein